MMFERVWAKVLLRQRLAARNAERERIARELHDTLLQSIQALLFRLAVWAGDPTIPAERRKEIATVVAQARAIVMEGRDRLLSLRGPDTECQDLLGALTELAGAQSNDQATRCVIFTSGEPRPVLVEACRELVDIAREALRNAQQHAGAGLVTLTVEYGHTRLRLRIVDDGRGIDPAVLRAGGRRGHFGLLGMRERAAQLGARFSIERDGTSGTRVTVVAPASVVFPARRTTTHREQFCPARGPEG